MSEAAVSISDSTVTINVFTKTLASFSDEEKELLGRELYEEIVRKLGERQAFVSGTANY